MHNFGYGMENQNFGCGCHECKRPEPVFCKQECKCKCYKMVEAECPKCGCKQMGCQNWEK